MKVLMDFYDTQDNWHLYRTGDTYPRAGYKPSTERIRELSGKDNLAGKPVITAPAKATKKR